MKLKPKTRALVFAAFFLNTVLVLEAQGTFGNNPSGGTAFTIGVEAGNTFGGAIAFTPLNSLALLSVTVWLDGFNGTNVAGDGPYEIIGGIYQNSGSSDQPGQELIDLGTLTHNDGSFAAFTFTNRSQSTILEADEKYWLFIYMTGGFAGSAASWVKGGTPMGGATYGGSQSFADGNFASSTATPAFNMNEVPELPTFALIGSGAAILLWSIFHRNLKTVHKG